MKTKKLKKKQAKQNKQTNKQTKTPKKRKEIEIRIKNSQMCVFSALLQLNKYHL
jgi:hypothetical protein